MLKNYLIVAIRNIFREKAYSILNVLGLAIGIACSFLIMLYIEAEFSYDKFYPNANRIYRLCITNNIGGRIYTYCNGPRPTSPKMKEIYPQVLESTRACGLNGLYTHKTNIEYERQNFISEKAFAVDSTFFKVFQTDFVQGNSEDALKRPDGVVLTESFARTIFGEEDPIGKTLVLDQFSNRTVTGVVKDLPGRTHFEYELLVPWSAAYRRGEENTWYGWHTYHYLLLTENSIPDELQKEFPDFYQEYMTETYNRINGKAELFLQPLLDIHLYSNYVWEMYSNGDINNIYIFGIVGIFLLLIACINYVNLATARSFRRKREVGMRKIFGSQRSALICQFLLESLILSLIAAFIAFWLVELTLPVFNSITTLNLSNALLSNPIYVFILILLGLLVGLLAGIYPAFFLTGLNPVHTLKTITFNTKKGVSLRKILIITQFMISAALIICTLVVIKQLHFAKNKKLGFKKDNIMVVAVQDTLMNRHINQFKEELTNYSEIKSAATSYDVPGETLNRFPARLESTEGTFDQMSCQFMQIDYDFIKTLEMKITKGRNFERDRENYWLDGLLVNEALVNKMGWEEPIGKRFLAFEDSLGNPNYIEIIGVVEDFHPNTVRQQIHPILIFLIPDDGIGYYPSRKSLFVNISNENILQTVDYVKSKWREYSPDSALRFFFLDDQLDRLYQQEERIIILFGYFSMITIFIACLGLLGLATFMAEQRRREIAVRKVLGSTSFQLVGLLSKDFITLIAFANLIAWPIAYLAMRSWLQNFAYRTTVNIWYFLLTAGISVIIALVSVSFQTIKAANTNPAEALQYE